MRIGIDAHYIGAQAGGNETHVANLLEGLKRLQPPEEIVVFAHAEMVDEIRVRYGFPVVPIPVHSSYLRVPFALPWLCWKHKIDLLHVHYTAPPWCPCAYVVTMHDLVAFRFPESMPFLTRHRLRLTAASTLRRAARVFTVSNAIRAEIADRFAIPADAITVTENVLTPEFQQPVRDADRERVRAKYGLPERYLLYVGQLQPRKNLVRLAQAFARLVAEGYPHSLVIVGKRAWLYGEMLREIETLNLGDRLQFTGFVAQEDLPAIYASAEVFGFVSLYEGFGIPVIEAIACGTPVLASTDPALVEAAGGGALHVDPRDVDAIAGALARLMTDGALVDDLAAAGTARVAVTTPEAMADAALAGYREALKAG